MKITLLYPPQQTNPEWQCKPEGSLAYPNLGAVLMKAGHDVMVFDACVGNDKDSKDIFYRTETLENGLVRNGVSDARILEEVCDSDVVGITSIFTAQESMALATARLIRKEYPSKLLVTGGTNARSRYRKFLDAGFNIVCMTEAERSLTRIMNGESLFDISGIVFDDIYNSRRNHFGYEINNPVETEDVVMNLDDLPIPAWELHPNDRYWAIGRPHGATPKKGESFKYSSMMTSLGCVFKCTYCHISGEGEDSPFGNVSSFRTKSTERVLEEFEKLKSLGVEELFLEDDTLFGHKRRGIEMLRSIKDFGFRLWDINGINIAHLLKPDRKTKTYVPDLEVLDVLADCAFTAISLPIESGSQRIIRKYASNKWDIARSDIDGLIQELLKRGISSGCNYMLGYPDETLEEIEVTIEIARQHMAAGAKSANFMLVIPLPGTMLYDQAIRDGNISKDFDPDTFNWRQASMSNTIVPAKELEQIHQAAYQELNGGCLKI